MNCDSVRGYHSMKFAVLYPRTAVLRRIAIASLLLLISFLQIKALSAATCASPFFVAGPTIPVGTQPSAVAVGDFNGDGRADLAVANQFSANVSVLIGRGDGTFQNAVNYPAGTGPSSVLARDLNGDGRLDLVVSDVGSFDVWVLLGNGNGTFQSADFYDVANTTQEIAAGDFNSDGKVDLIAALQLNGTVQVLTGVGNGTFTVGAETLVGVDPVSVATGDFNGDGRSDVVVANASFEDTTFSSISVLISRNSGGFFNAVDYDAGSSPRSVAVGDFNGDGKLDLAVANYGFFNGTNFLNSSVSILIGTGTGTFQPAVNYTPGEGPDSIVVRDLNVDGKLDLVVANFRSMNVSIFYGRGDGTFQPAINYDAGTSPRQVTVGSFNSNTDTNLDLAFVHEFGAALMLSTCILSDLAITQTVAPNPVPFGSNIVFTLSVTNSGSDSAPDATVTDQLPPGVSFVSFTTSQGSCNNNSGLITCALGNMTNGARATVTITVTATNSGSLSNTGMVSSATRPDPSLGNNTAISSFSVIPVVSLSVIDSSAAEAGNNVGIFMVSRTGTSGSLPVSYTVGGTAINGTDYPILSGSVTIPNGLSSATVTVTPIDDNIPEQSETVILTLSANPAAYTINPASDTGTVTIFDNDLYPVVISDATVTEGDSGTSDAVFTLTLGAPSSQTVAVSYATANGTAVAGVDYVSTNGTVTFPAGTTNQTIIVKIIGDSLNEATENFFVNLSNPVNTIIGDAQGVGTINDQDPPPSLSINDVTVREGTSGTTNLVFTISLSAASGQTVSANFATANGTAIAGSDYATTNGTVTFAPGTTTRTVTVLVNGDVLSEPAENFFMNLSGPVNATIADGQGVGTILNALPPISVADASFTEGNSGTSDAVFIVSLLFASTDTVTVDFSTPNGTASPGSDYVPTNGIVIFAPGVTNRTITVRIIGDLLNEANETFFINLSNPTNAVIPDVLAVGTINNDDPLPSASVNDVTVTEGNSGAIIASFTVSLSAVSGQSVTMNYATADGTASAGSDYTAASGALTFPPGLTTQTIFVNVNGDLLNEANETFFVNLSNPSNVVLGDSQGVGTISNDDPLPLLSINDVTVTEGNSGSTNAVFTVSLSAASGQTVTVNFATTNGTATAGNDYTATNGTLSFPPGTISRTITVPVSGDLLNELDETFLVNLSSPVNAAISDGQGVGTILNNDPVPTLSISDVAVNEGDSGTTPAVFTVTLSAPSGRTVTVNYSTANGTAVAPSDYTATNGVLSFAPGITSQNISVSVRGDLVNEVNESFTVNLNNPTNATVADAQGTGTINNDDSIPTVSINDVTVSERVSGTVNATFTVSLSSISGKTITVNYATTNGTATAGEDYVGTNGVLTFTAGTTTQTVTVVVNGDLLNEDDETFFVNLSGAVNATIADGQGLGTILNVTMSVSIDDASLTEGNSGTSGAVFVVSLPFANTNTVTVNFATANGTAVAGIDYVATNGTLIFVPGVTNQTITVPIIGDLINEADETFFVNLSNATNAPINDGQALGTINNDDPLPSASINNVTVAEGNSGTATAVFTVSLSIASGQTVTMNYATADDTANAGSDYTAASGILTFAPGVTTQTISVNVNGDLLNEANETFFVDLSNPVNVLLGDPQGVGTISNDDPLPILSVNDVTVTEGNSGTVNAVFTVSLSAVSGRTVTANFATTNGTATAGSDYTATNGVLNFPPGTTSASITVVVSGDLLNEGDDTFFLNLSAPVNATLGDGQGLGTILNDDSLPSLSINDVTVTEGDSGTTAALFTVTLSAPSGRTVTVNYSTVNGTAVAGSDFTAANSTLSFTAGVTSQTISIPVIGELVNEIDESFTINLSNPVNATLTDSQGMGTIVDNDPLPSLSINDVTVNEGNSGTANATFTVTLSPVSGKTVTVNYATADGTAIAGNDYLSGSGVVTFTPGQATRTITVSVLGDLVNEANDTFLVNLSTPVNAIISDGQGVGTINNDDALPLLSISDVSVSEGNSGTNALFNVQLSALSEATVTVNFATANGTATNIDYVATNGVVTFPPGTTNQIISVAIVGDLGNEANETFFVNLSNPVNATIGDGQGVGTIVNDDPPPTISISDAAVFEGNSGTAAMVFQVTLASPSSLSISVTYSTADGTAARQTDYARINPTTLTFAPGQTTNTITVSVNGDTTVETNESIFVNLSNPINATITDNQGIGWILNDDGVPSISVNDVTVTEGNSGTVNAVFNVRLSAASSQLVNVNFATADGTATAGSDYSATNGLINFSPGVTNQTVTVRINGDLMNELNETFFLNLSRSTNALISDSQGICTINNDDPLPTLSIDDVSVAEGDSGVATLLFTVTLSPPSGQAVTVNFSTADGTATVGSDYGANSGTLSFGPGVTTRTIPVSIFGDTLSEDNETFFVNLSNPVNATLADNQGVGGINNDDAVPSLSISDVTVVEGDSGTTNAVFTVTLSEIAGRTVTVNYATASGTASAGTDYVATNSTLTFAPGVMTQTIAVRVNGDIVNEANETFFVNLSNPLNATLSDNQALGTIQNDDPAPSLSISDVTVVEGNSGTTNAVFTLTLSPASGQNVSVNFMTQDGTAVAGADYVGTNITVTFNPGVTTQTVAVRVLGEGINEANETFFANLSGAVNANLIDSQGFGIINNDDPVPSISINDVSVSEGNFGQANAVFTLSLSTVSGQSVTVNYSTANGTAIAGVDYAFSSGTVTFLAGTPAQTITIPINGDLLNELDETFFVNLSSPVNAMVADGQGTGTILNDDPLPSLSINDVTVTEGNSGTTDVIFTVSLSTASGQSVSASYSTANGTAVADSDYFATNGVVTFAPGVTIQTITVRAINDAINEGNETFFVNLNNPINATIADGQGTGTINNDDPVPSLSISDVTVTEGNSGTTDAIFTVSLSTASGQSLSVSYATANNTAVGGTDFISTNGTLNFAPGTTSQSITVKVIGETVNEANETFFVNLSNPINVTITDNQAVGTINNDDPLPTLSINDITVIEGDSGASDALFTVTLSAVSGQTVTVNYATGDGSALAGSDYTSTNGSLTFAPGTTSQTVTIKVNGDTINEANEMFFVNLSGPSNATLADGQGAGTISNDDPMPALAINNVTVTEGNSGSTNATFTVSLSTVSGQAVTVSYATADGTAVAGADYVSTSGTLSFPPGTTSQTVTVVVLSDGINEASETFAVNLSNPINATLGDGQGTGTINNDDPVPALSISDATVTEGDSGTVNALFTVNLSTVSGQALTVNYATVNGTAIAGADYISTNGLLSFPPGTTSQTIRVAVIGDLINEANEIFFVNLSNPTNATLADNQASGTINNDDPLPTLSIADVTVTEGNSGTSDASFTVTLSSISGQTVTVNYASANGTAIAGTDYASTNGTLTFAPGTLTQTINVRVNGDNVNEANETFFVNLSGALNATIARNQGVGMINNDDPLPAVSINNVTVTEANTINTNAIFTVTLSPASGQTVTIAYATADGTATAGSDYVGTNGTLSFAPGTTTQTIVVVVLPDSINEANETFSVNLSNPSNTTITDGQGTGTISNDDPLPSLTINDIVVTEGDAGTTAALFTVSLSALSGQTVTVNYASSNGTAIAGADYLATNGMLSFPPGTMNQTISVAVLGDLLNEPNETFFVSLSNATAAVISDSQGRATINNDDPLPTLSINDVTIAEGDSGTVNASFAVNLSTPSGQTVTVNYSTANGTASSGSDYASTNGLLTFAPGTVLQTVTVRVNGDLINESDETFFVNLSNPTNAIVSDSQGIGTISDNDPLPSLSITGISVTEGNSGTTDANFRVTLSVASGQTVTVNYASASDTATAGTDFASTNGTLMFASGVTTQFVTVRVTGDLLNELNETFFVNLSAPVNGTIASGQAVGTINNDDALPAITITDRGVVEGDTGETNALFTVRLSAASGQTVTVNYATANGLAAADSDYVGTNGVVTFAAGTTNQAIQVVVLGDLLNESNETFFVNLSNPINATISDTQAVGTITNDDPVVSITISDTSIIEGNTGTNNAAFDVTLSQPSGQTVSVSYATADGTATRQSGDYGRIVSAVLTFVPGQTNQTAFVTVNGDTAIENNETFLVTLSAPVNATLANSQATGTILNDDGLAAIAISDVTLSEGNSGTTAATFNVRLLATNSQPVTVNYSTADGSALAGSDYFATNGLVSFSPGVTNQVVTVRVIGDLLNEPNETFFVNLSNPTNAAVLDAQAIGTINNDDAVPGISINDVTVTEGNSGTADAVFAVSLAAASGQTITVNYATANGTATAGVDYISTNGTLTFAPGTTVQTIVVKANGDTINEANETFFVNLSSPVNATLSDGQAVGTISNDDPLPSLSVNDISITEGDSGTTTALFTVTLATVSGQAVTVNFATGSGTATAGSDYISTNGSISIPPGATTQTIAVAVVGDVLNEANETFVLNLSNPVNATLTDPQGVATINNDDALPTLSISNVTVTEGNSGTTNAIFTVSLSESSGQNVTVNYSTTNDTALVGADYISTNGTLSFAPGTLTQTVIVRVIGDLLDEPIETFFVNLSNPLNANLLDAQALGTILDDDGGPALSISDATVTEGNAGLTDAIFTVNLSVASGQTVTVNYATANGTATAGVDYASTNGTISFAPGTTSQTIVVKVSGDLLNETDETFLVNLSSPLNATVAGSSGTGTISNDDPLPALSIADVIAIEGNFGTTNALFTISLSAASGQTVTINFATADDTAGAGSDYAATNGTVTFAPGIVARNIAVSVIGDILNEGNETFFVNLSDPVNAIIANGQAVGTITNDDQAVPTLSITDAAVIEGDNGTTNLIFTVSVRPVSSQVVSINYATADGTALAGIDYSATNGTLMIPAGIVFRTFIVPVRGDILSEGDENFLVLLSNPTNAVLAASQAVGTILDDDPLNVMLSTNTLRVVEGASNSFTVRLNTPPANDVTVNIQFDSGDLDLSLTTHSNIVFNSTNWNITQSVTIAAAEDPDLINGQAFFSISSPGLGSQTVKAIEQDNDVMGLVLSSSEIFVPEGGTNSLTVWLSTEPASDVIVNVRLEDGDGDLRLVGAANIVFTPANWNLPQPVSFSDAEDADQFDGHALFSFSASGLSTRTVTATEVDNDLAQPRITSIEIDDVDVVIRFTTSQNRIYRLERADTLSPDAWTVAADNIAGTGNVAAATDVGSAGARSRFYRIRQTPPSASKPD